MSKKKFVGFGFGPIQAGLMLYEAQQSVNFDSYAIAEIDQFLVDAVRSNADSITINISKQTGIVTANLTHVKLYNPHVPADRDALCSAINQADELATAIPSVNFYSSGGDNSITALLAQNINPEKPQILYASENNNYAASILVDEIKKRNSSIELKNFQALDTVIGKMSGTIQSTETIKTMGLKTITPHLQRAILVEEFNRIYISKITLPGYKKGIKVFDEKDDLLPFEEAKLFGHNAIHSMLGYLAYTRGYSVMSQIRSDKELMALGRSAFIDESGAALIKKHSLLKDPLFTPKGYEAFADDLIERMTNPFLHDEVARICRDPARKLGYNDRLFGTMREALRQGIKPVNLVKGAYAALQYYALESSKNEAAKEQRGDAAIKLPLLSPEQIKQYCLELWRKDILDEYSDECIKLVIESQEREKASG